VLGLKKKHFWLALKKLFLAFFWLLILKNKESKFKKYQKK